MVRVNGLAIRLQRNELCKAALWIMIMRFMFAFRYM